MMPTMSNPKSKTGFTLAEAMIAMVVLSTAAAAVILPFSAGAAVHNESARQTMAAQLASEMLEKIKNEPFDMLWLYEGYIEAAGAMYDANLHVYTDDAYARFWRRTACADAIVAGETLKWVTAYVYYGNNEIMRLSTLVGPA
jgi:prepilin-type N-terminal cleavage/methylation domain-containing protein